MAVRHGYGKIAGTDALVFAYDTGDTRNSYKGEPATNLALFSMNVGFSSDYPSNITFTDDSTVTYQGRQSKKVVSTGTWNIYRYPRSGNYTATSSSTFTYSFKIKWSDGRTPSFGNGYIYTDAISTYPGITVRAIEDGWFWCYCTYNSTSSPPTLTGFTTTQTGTCWIVDWQLEAGRLHPTPYVAPGGTRSATQGLLDLTGRSTVDLTNVSFDSNAQLFFDGTDDLAPITGLTISATQNKSYEAVIKIPSGYAQNGAIFAGRGNSSNMFGIYSDRTLRGGEDDQFIVSTSLIPVDVWCHVAYTFEFDGVTTSVQKLYINGQLDRQVTQTNYIDGYVESTLYLGYDWRFAYYFNGNINVCKVYNRALTADEVRNNYNQYKGRFNI